MRHDPQVIAGRFYLLHMLCIKPETTQYRVCSSCDYSFIPEMCPSGNVAIIDDSDDYLVVEAQSKEHQVESVTWGPYDQKKLTHALSEWTTKQHRENANQNIYYHSRDITDSEKVAIENKLNKFTNVLALDLQKI